MRKIIISWTTVDIRYREAQRERLFLQKNYYVYYLNEDGIRSKRTCCHQCIKTAFPQHTMQVEEMHETWNQIQLITTFFIKTIKCAQHSNN